MSGFHCKIHVVLLIPSARRNLICPLHRASFVSSILYTKRQWSADVLGGLHFAPDVQPLLFSRPSSFAFTMHPNVRHINGSQSFQLANHHLSEKFPAAILFLSAAPCRDEPYLCLPCRLHNVRSICPRHFIDLITPQSSSESIVLLSLPPSSWLVSMHYNCLCLPLLLLRAKSRSILYLEF